MGYYSGSYYNRLYNFLILPSVYDDSISYLEMVGRLHSLILEVIKALDEKDQEYYDYVDKKFAEAEAEIAASAEKIRQDMAQMRTEIEYDYNTKIDALRTDMETEFQKILSLVYQINTIIASMRAEWEAYTDAKVAGIINKVNSEVAALKEYVDKAIVGQIQIFNIFRNQYTDIQTAFDDYYNYMRAGALTAIEYDNLRLTANEYDRMGLKAWMYDVGGRWYFNRILVIDPTTGLLGPVQTAIDSLANFHKNSYTCAEYDALNLTAQVYDDKGVTAYVFDFSSKTALAA